MPDDATVEFVVNGQSHTLVYRDSDHSYRLDGKRIVSVSTLSKVCYSDPGGLMHYAWKHGMNGVDYKEETKFTQQCGEAAHAQLQALATTGQALDLTDQPERVRGALQAVAKWWLDCKPEFIASEVIVCHPGLRYAGRFDFLCSINGETFLGDLKTTDKPWDHFKRYKAAAAYAQLAGYHIAYDEMHGPGISRRAILHVNTSGDYDWKPDLAPEKSEEAFLSKVQTYRADQAWSKAYEAERKALA